MITIRHQNPRKLLNTLQYLDYQIRSLIIGYQRFPDICLIILKILCINQIYSPVSLTHHYLNHTLNPFLHFLRNTLQEIQPCQRLNYINTHKVWCMVTILAPISNPFLRVNECENRKLLIRFPDDNLKKCIWDYNRNFTVLTKPSLLFFTLKKR